MTRRLQVLLVLVLSFVCMASGRATAGDYVNCQTCSTTPAGEVETEAWNDVSNGSAFRQVGVSHGINERFQVTLYGQAYDSTNQPRLGEAFLGSKVEAVYRLTPEGKLPVDLGFYMQYAKSDLFGPGQMGGRFILSRDLGRINLTVNVGLSRTSQPGSVWGTEFVAAARCPLGDRMNVGVEFVRAADGSRALIHRLQVKVSPDVQVGVGAALTTEQPNRPLQFLGNVSVRL